MKVFVGGWGGSGTRVIMRILKEYNINIGNELNSAYDYLPILDDIIKLWHGKDNKLKEICDREGKDWALKHGQLMFCPEKIKKIYPRSKFILMVRHPIDNIMNDFNWHETYLNGYSSHDNILMNKMICYEKSHMHALKYADMVIRLEDVVENSKSQIRKLKRFFNIKSDNINADFIVKPMTMGRRYTLSESDQKMLRHLGRNIIAKLRY